MKYLLYFISFLFLSCTGNKKNDTLEEALILAGENRKELEKVLTFYSHNVKDSLKYKAACFLIENMPQYYYYEGELLDNYAEYYSLLFKEKKIKPEILLDSVQKKYGNFDLDKLEIKYDINEIDSAYLCNNIEWSFKVWKEQPWAKHITFENFCEYILPYRLGNEQPVYWKEKLYNRYLPLFKNVEKIPDINNPVKASRILTDSLRKSYRFTTFAPADMPRLGPDVSSYLCGSCQDITDYTMYACRALGIACHLDFLQVRGDGNSGHFWISYNDNEGNLHIQDFLGHITPVRSSHLIREFSKLKAYRYTFSQNREMLNEMKKMESVLYPFFEDANFIDVTVYYADCFVETLIIPSNYLYKKKSKSGIAYLCLISRTEWIPVCWTRFDKNNLYFQNLSKGNVVRVATWENGVLVFQSPPFCIHSPTGELSLFLSQIEKQKVILLSKIDLKAEDMFRKRMIHGVFEASNAPDFVQKDTLFHIIEKPNRLLTHVKVNNNQKYRYVRYFGPDEGFCNISEVAFFEKENDTLPLTGKIIGTPGTFNNSTNKYLNVFDGKTDTSFDYIDKYGGWAGVDLGEPKNISTIVYTPRNRDNYIRPGDTYELFFTGNNDWESLGVITAQSDSLVYTDVPQGALLYLKNHTRGVDERIFTYEDGKQKWK